MAQLKVKGIKNLDKRLKKNRTLSEVKAIVKHHGIALTNKMHKNAVFTKGYSTGATERSIALSFKDEGLTAIVAPGTEYSEYVEYGTRKMEAQPFVRPTFNEQAPKFIQDMKKLVK